MLGCLAALSLERKCGQMPRETEKNSKKEIERELDRVRERERSKKREAESI